MTRQTDPLPVSLYACGVGFCRPVLARIPSHPFMKTVLWRASLVFLIAGVALGLNQRRKKPRRESPRSLLPAKAPAPRGAFPLPRRKLGSCRLGRRGFDRRPAVVNSRRPARRHDHAEKWRLHHQRGDHRTMPRHCGGADHRHCRERRWRGNRRHPGLQRRRTGSLPRHLRF